MFSVDQFIAILKQYKIQTAAIIAFILVIGGWFIFQSGKEDTSKDALAMQQAHRIEMHQEKSTSKDKKDQSTQKIIVDIKGAVKKPDTYEMQGDDRMKQLLDKAEPLKTADLSHVNLAEKLTDQKMVYIPSQGEVSPSNAHHSVQQDHSSTPSATQNITVNLNTADEKELTQIPGIGPSKAQTIIKHREENGPFQSIENLKDVKGIGEKSFEKLKDYLTV
ncbi:helix-hairpin-helix domain-containing protein [Staphylococcus intermedius]|uniref:ComE operon protein 1 n=1 Tax=Staphylococcus intermedius NCTC 11048 TaxID=1141106 RepID=A0A380G8L9_STAIN|nr:helix-hairpin-helix domain-containing protein [Staphylococcus intermedius]PCF64773.1 competence protein ComEA [Staphylococcus intermedius]PCF80383.1 competence protein ComEA [Staphylococcus intermedius]PCF81733.1 competence protein ComEA [Staphylococcus intermedius]PCF88071.1 competence protein ComEA [Staphylococcus intermedius]PCF88784.1 competence protein ComEA [Staphylococcus intermedius]